MITTGQLKPFVPNKTSSLQSGDNYISYVWYVWYVSRFTYKVYIYNLKLYFNSFHTLVLQMRINRLFNCSSTLAKRRSSPVAHSTRRFVRAMAILAIYLIVRKP